MAKHIITEDCEYIKTYPAQSLQKLANNEAWVNDSETLNFTKKGKLFLHNRGLNYINEEKAEGDLDICTVTEEEGEVRQWANLHAPLRHPAHIPEVALSYYCIPVTATLNSEVIVQGAWDCRGGGPFVYGIILPDILPEPWPNQDWVYGGGTTYMQVGIPAFTTYECGLSAPGELCLDCCFESSSSPGLPLAGQVFIPYTFMYRPYISGVGSNVFLTVVNSNQVITCSTSTDGSTKCYYGLFAPHEDVNCGTYYPGGVFPPYSVDINVRTYTGLSGIDVIPSCDWRNNLDEDGNYNGIPVLNCDMEQPYERTDGGNHPCG